MTDHLAALEELKARLKAIERDVACGNLSAAQTFTKVRDAHAAAIALMRGQSDIFAAVRMLLDSAPAHMTPRNAKEREAYKLLRALTGVCNCPGGSKPAQFHAPNCPAREVTKETT